MQVFITGADRGLGLSMTKQMLDRNYTVFAGRYLQNWNELDELKTDYPDKLHLIPIDISKDESVETAIKLIAQKTEYLDVIIFNAAIIGASDDTRKTFTDTEMMLNVYNVNTIGNVRVFEHGLSLLMQGHLKKACFVSSEAGSISQNERTNFFWYGMTKASLNYYVKTMFNRHRDEIKFRLYQPGWIKSYMKGYIDSMAELTPDEAARYAIDYFFDAEVNEDELVLKSYDGNVLSY